MMTRSNPEMAEKEKVANLNVLITITNEKTSETKSKKPFLRKIIKPSSERWSNQVSNTLASQQEPISRREVVNTDQVHQDWRS